MMKKALVPLFLLLAQIKSATYWFTIDGNAGGQFTGHTVGISGPNEELFIQGVGNRQRVFSIDWVNGGTQNPPNPTETLTITLNTDNSHLSRIASDGTYNVVASRKKIMRYFSKPGGPLNLEEYPLVSTDGQQSIPVAAKGTVYMFVAPRIFSGVHKAYRLHSDRITDIQSFGLGSDSRAYGVLYGTPWVVFSIQDSKNRRLYDFTKAYEGGPGGAGTINFHFKDDAVEVGFVSPTDRRPYYAVCAQNTLRLLTTKNDGEAHLTVGLPQVGTAISLMSWITDSDLVFVPGKENNFYIVNFMDAAVSPVLYTFHGGSGESLNSVVWSNYKAFSVNRDNTKESLVYKLLDEMPCGGLCGACDGVFRNKCVDCQSGASKVAGTNTCSCDSGFYEKAISPTRKECPACSPLCLTCSGGAATDCGTCKHSFMEKKDDGSCGCPDGKYFSGTTCVDCDSSCLTCSGAGPTSCLSCEVSKSMFLFVSSCMNCDASCKTCSGSSPNQCLSCDASLGKYLSGTTCISCPAGSYRSGSSCSPCDSSCTTCYGSTASNCLTCSTLGFFLNSGKCSSCSEYDSVNCPDPIAIKAPLTIQELTQNLTISFAPSLNDPLTRTFKITPEELTEKHIKFQFKRKEKVKEPLTILETKLTHSNNSSELFIKFLQKLRISNTDQLIITIDEPVLFRTTASTTPQKFKYLKKKEYSIPVIGGEGTEEAEEKKMMEQTLSAYKITRGAVAVTASSTVVLAGSSGILGPLVYVIRMVNIIEVISNLQKMNVRFGSRIQGVINFIGKFKFPEFGLLARLSPLKDASFEDPDADAYVLMTRGMRGKITTSNEEIFIASGQNFVIGAVIIIFWGFWFISGFCLDKNSKVLKYMAFVYQGLLGMVFFDFELICLAEIALLDYSRLFEMDLKFLVSLLMSCTLLHLIGFELYRGFKLIKHHLKWSKTTTKNNQKGKKMTEGDQQIFDKYSEGLKKEAPG